MTLQEGLHRRTAGDAPPRELQLSAAPQPASTGVAGPLPFDVGQGRTGCGAAIIEPASFDNVDDDDGMAADGGDGRAAKMAASRAVSRAAGMARGVAQIMVAFMEDL